MMKKNNIGETRDEWEKLGLKGEDDRRLVVQDSHQHL